MHSVVVNYIEPNMCRSYSKSVYKVTLECKMTHGIKEVALIRDPADALRYANWKGTELGIPVVLCDRLKEILGMVRKKIKKDKKKKRKE